MRRVHRPWSVLVVVALVGLFGPAATASAGDAGLRALVTEQRAAEKQVEERMEGAVAVRPGASSHVQAARRIARDLRRLARLSARARRVQTTFGRRFAAETAETNEALTGQRLMVRGLRDEASAYRDVGRVANRYAAKLRRVRTAAGLERILGRLATEVARAGERGERGERRIERGRTLIRTAPVAPAPAR